MKRKICGALCAALLSGCASAPPEQVVMVGLDTYMVRQQGNPANLSVTGVRAVMLKQAEDFCQGMGLRMQEIINLSREKAIGAYAQPEVQFKCLASGR